MIVAISIDREFDNYTEFYTSLVDISTASGFKEFCGLESPILSRFITEAKKPVQTFKIDWGVSKSTPQEFVKMNKNNKPYNSQAPFDAAKKVVAYATRNLKRDRPIHLLGIGGIRDILSGVEQGIDTFECVAPTRMARHGGSLLLKADKERINLNKTVFR